MAYADLTDDLKPYLSIAASVTKDDALLQSFLDAAQQVIDNVAGRAFETTAETGVVFYGDEIRTLDGKPGLQWYDRDLLTLTTVVDDDGNSYDVVTIPRRTPPIYAIKFADNIPNGDAEITITGVWDAFTATAPDDIKHATVRLAAWYYRQRDSFHDGAGATINTANGTVIVPAGIPKDVMQLITPYCRI